MFKILPLVFLLSVVSPGVGESLSPADLKGLLERIREKRAAAPRSRPISRSRKRAHAQQTDRQLGQGLVPVAEQIPTGSKGKFPQHHGERWTTALDLLPEIPVRRTLFVRQTFAAGCRHRRDHRGLNLENVEALITSPEQIRQRLPAQLTPRNPSMKRFLQKFTIQLSDDLRVERTEMLQPNGDQIVTTYQNPNHAAISPSQFEFTPPPGTEVSTPLGK